MAEEKQFENKVKRLLESYKIYPLGGKFNDDIEGYYEKRWGGGYFTKAGLPDLSIIYMGIPIEVELKAEKGRVSNVQNRTLNQIHRAKVDALVLKPSNINELVEILEKIKEFDAFYKKCEKELFSDMINNKENENEK